MLQAAYTLYDPSKEIPGKPDYYQTVRYIFQHINFAISEDEAYVILNLFIEKWDDSQGESLSEKDFSNHIVDRCRSEFVLFLSEQKIEAVTGLIISYLRSIDQFH
jgi:hypothetical protein